MTELRQIAHFFYMYIVSSLFLSKLVSNHIANSDTEQQQWQINQLALQTPLKPKSNCCQDDMIIKSTVYPQGYLRSPPFYEQLNKPENYQEYIECIYTFIGKPGERIQLFYEDLDMYYPFDIYRFNKIDCRYADSICLKFYENSNKTKLLVDSKPQLGSKSNSTVTEHINLENSNYDFCNCINVSYTPRQILSANNFIQVRFKSVVRSHESEVASKHSNKYYRGYLIRYQFTKDFGLNLKDGGELDPNGECKIYFRSSSFRSGYFSSPNYPGIYPRDTECHYYFLGNQNERIQITFHTFDVEGIDMCLKKTKSDYIELSNFQNRDRFYSRYCGSYKPGTVVSDSSFFHVTFFSNDIFDGKGFHASYYFINISAEFKNRNIKKSSAIKIKETTVSSIISTNKIGLPLNSSSSSTSILSSNLFNWIPMLTIQCSYLLSQCF